MNYMRKAMYMFLPQLGNRMVSKTDEGAVVMWQQLE